ncbi:MAG: AlpA family phage regulatory protein [Pseudomonadales bacterium]
MYREDILERLRVDPGKRTLGELLQDRESAVHEITRLRAQIVRLTAARTPRARKGEETDAPPQMRPGMLIRLAEVCELIGVGRSTIYKWMNEGTFPAPVNVSERAVRWRTEDIEHWRNALTR